MVKRSLSDGESEFEDTPPPVSPPTTFSKKKTKSTPVKSERKPSTPGKSGLSAQQKRIIIDFMIEATRKAPDFSSLCEKAGLSKTQLKDHFVPNRSNFRSNLEKLFDA